MDRENLLNYGSGGKKYRLILPDVVAAANQNWFDLFNATASGKLLLVCGIFCIVKTDVAVTGVVAMRIDFFRTTAVGTGGTAATADATSIAASIAKSDSTNPALPSGITARSVPTGGATKGPWLDFGFAFPEETASQAGQRESFNMLHGGPLALRPGEGLLAQQGSVASLNNFGFVVDMIVY